MTKQIKDSKGRNLNKGESQLQDGRYRYRYVDKNGKRRTLYSWKLVKTDKTPKGKKDSPCLREQERNIQRDVEDGIRTYDAKVISVYDLIMKYLELKPTLANSTLQNYLSMVDTNIKPSIMGSMKIADVKTSDVKAFYSFLYKKKKFATTTIQLYQNIIYPAFELAVKDDLIRKNPCKDCMKDYATSTNGSTKYALNRTEERALLDYVENHNWYSRYYVMIAFMLGTGCRVGEVIGLTWDDIDFENRTVSINHQVIYKKDMKTKKTRHYVSLPKNKTVRTIPLKDDIFQILSDYRMRTYFVSKANDYSIDGYSCFVFLNDELKVYTPNTIRRSFHAITENYNRSHDYDDEIRIREFTPHTLRHTFCTRMAENGLDIKVLQSIMGHKTIAVTMQVYNHVDSERTLNNFEKVASALAV